MAKQPTSKSYPKANPVSIFNGTKKKAKSKSYPIPRDKNQ